MTKRVGERQLCSKGGIDGTPVQQGTCVPVHLLFAERQTLHSFYEVGGVPSFFSSQILFLAVNLVSSLYCLPPVRLNSHCH